MMSPRFCIDQTTLTDARVTLTIELGRIKEYSGNDKNSWDVACFVSKKESGLINPPYGLVPFTRSCDPTHFIALTLVIVYRCFVFS